MKGKPDAKFIWMLMQMQNLKAIIHRNRIIRRNRKGTWLLENIFVKTFLFFETVHRAFSLLMDHYWWYVGDYLHCQGWTKVVFLLQGKYLVSLLSSSNFKDKNTTLKAEKYWNQFSNLALISMQILISSWSRTSM